ncbi:reverse transcriptase domain-containing protein [Tanacetum coccineum]
MEACIAEHAATPIPPTSPTYNQAPLGHRAAMICMRDDILEEDMPSWRRFVLTAPPPGCDSYHDARTIARAADRVEDVGYVRSLQASEHMMMTFIEEVNLRVSYQAQVRRKESEIFYTQLHNARTKGINIRLEIDVVRGQRTAYETEFAIRIMPVTRQGTNDAVTPKSIQAIIDRAIQRNSTQDDGSQSSGGGIRRPVHCWLVLMDQKDGIRIPHCAIENQLKFSSCTLLGAALTWWNGHVRTLGHDAAYAMTWGTFKKKLTDKYCPNGEIKKLEMELWNLKVRGKRCCSLHSEFPRTSLDVHQISC